MLHPHLRANREDATGGVATAIAASVDVDVGVSDTEILGARLTERIGLFVGRENIRQPRIEAGPLSTTDALSLGSLVLFRLDCARMVKIMVTYCSVQVKVFGTVEDDREVSSIVATNRIASSGTLVEVFVEKSGVGVGFHLDVLDVSLSRSGKGIAQVSGHKSQSRERSRELHRD